MKAGREMDALVEHHIFGKKILTHEEMCVEAERVWVRQPACQVFNGLGGFYVQRQEDGSIWAEQRLRPRSTSISAAWEVVEKLRSEEESEGWEFTLSSDADEWGATFWMGDTFHDSGAANTTPLAICLAALKAVGESDEG